MDNEQQLVEAVQRAERTGTSAQQANALDHLAEHYHLQRNFEAASDAYRRALALWRGILGPKHPSVGTLMVNLGQIYEQLGRLDAAEPMFRQALTIFEADTDFDDVGVVEAFERFGASLARQGRDAEAERFAERVRRIAAQVQVLVTV